MIFRKNEYSALDAAIEAAQRFRTGILCDARVKLFYSGLMLAAPGDISFSFWFKQKPVFFNVARLSTGGDNCY
ncbi:hypothetical protein AB833_29580 [Chromatiales bacterium (ex Bugula neritina AB1)]|nr:hypothetical protein AB833_29580 [Chromatiales bacterium (ex Bugula neritina AB1)]